MTEPTPRWIDDLDVPVEVTKDGEEPVGERDDDTEQSTVEDEEG